MRLTALRLKAKQKHLARSRSLYGTNKTYKLPANKITCDATVDRQNAKARLLKIGTCLIIFQYSKNHKCVYGKVNSSRTGRVRLVNSFGYLLIIFSHLLQCAVSRNSKAFFGNQTIQSQTIRINFKYYGFLKNMI